MSLPFWTTEPSDYLEPRTASSKTVDRRPITFAEAFKGAAQVHGNEPALHLKKPSSVGGKMRRYCCCLCFSVRCFNPLLLSFAKCQGLIPTDWIVWSWKDYWTNSCKFAKTLIYMNVDYYHVVNILGFNSPEWLVANSGSILASCISAGIYITNLPAACHYITGHSKAEVIVLEGNTQLAKYCNVSKSTLPFLKAIVVFAEDSLDQSLLEKCSFPVFHWNDFLALGNEVSDAVLEARMAGARPGNCATLIYTSGTTGSPKAVMISHDNLTWTVKTLVDNFFPDVNATSRICSFLPLSHIAGQILDIHMPIYTGAKVYFCQSDALKNSLITTLKEVRPTFFLAVPRVWEKMMEMTVQASRGASTFMKLITKWARIIGLRRAEMHQFGKSRSAPLGYSIANALVFHKVKEMLGLDKATALCTAAAPISMETLLYFASLDIHIYELFGQSECTGPHTVSAPGQWRMGYCGRPMPGTESKIDPSTGELCYRGRHVFMGYMYMPQETAETIDNESCLHSGDVAEFDDSNNPSIPAPSGFMKITGRIKELIITAGGENVPPVLIENEMKAQMNAISNCVVIGDRRKFLSVLITLKTEIDKDTGVPTNRLRGVALYVSKKIGSSATTVEEATADPLWTKYIENGIKAANKKTTSHAQTVHKWHLLHQDFSEKTGELTPTMKVKRRVIEEKYGHIIDTIYAE